MTLPLALLFNAVLALALLFLGGLWLFYRRARDRAERALRQSERRLRQIIDLVPHMVFAKDRKGRLLLVNRAVAEAYGTTVEKLVGQEHAGVHATEAEVAHMLADDQEVIDRGRPKFIPEEEFTDKAGRRRLLQTTKVPFTESGSNEPALLGVAIDITERKQAEEALRDSRRRTQEHVAELDHLYRTAPVGLALLDCDLQYVGINELLAALNGRPIAEHIGRTVREVIPRLAPLIESACRRVLETGEPTVNQEVHGPSPTEPGGERDWLASYYPIRSEGGAVSGVSAVILEITERKQAERAVRESEAKYRALIETTGTGYLIIDAEGRVLDANAEYVRLTGHRRLDEILNRSVIEWTAPHDLRRNAEEVKKCAARGVVRDLEIDYVDSQGKVTPIEINATVIETAQGRRIVSLCRDISERRRQQAERDELHRRERAARAEAESAIDKLRALQIVMDATLAPLSLDDLLAELLGRIRVVLKADTASILFRTEDGQHLQVRASAGLEEEVGKGITVPYGQGVCGRIADSRDPVVVPDLAQVEVLSPILRARVRSLMGARLLVGGRVTGVIHVGSHGPRSFADDDLRLLQIVAERAAGAIERAQLYEKVRADHEQLKVLSRRLLEAQEAERRRLACELHDEIGQVFTAIKINLQTLKRHAGADALPHLEDSIGIVDQAIQQVRHLALELRPSMLDDLGLSAALRWYVDSQVRRAGLTAHLALDLPDGRLPPELETVCFRVVQEALTNVLRHAQARQVWIEIRQQQGALELSVRDDGAGFDPQAARERAVRGASLGLLGMQERVQLVEGELVISSRPDGGTEVRARLPLEV